MGVRIPGVAVVLVQDYLFPYLFIFLLLKVYLTIAACTSVPKKQSDHFKIFDKGFDVGLCSCQSKDGDDAFPVREWHVWLITQVPDCLSDFSVARRFYESGVDDVTVLIWYF